MKRLSTSLLTVWLLAACSGNDGGVTVNSSAPLNPEHQQTDPDLPFEPPVIGAATGSPREIGQWSEVIEWPLVPVSVANLPDGRLLTYSGGERRTWGGSEQSYTAVWDPETGGFEERFHDGHNMFCAGLSMTGDGQVMVTGGRNSGASKWASLFDYRETEWNQIDNMASGGRWYPGVMTLGDGSILSMMGDASNRRNPDLWHPEEGWKVVNGATFPTGSWWPWVTLAPDGNVFNYWSTNSSRKINISGNGVTNDVDPDTDKDHIGGIYIQYDIGKVFNAGGQDSQRSSSARKDAMTVDLNGSVPIIRATNPMLYSRTFQNLVVAPTGEIYVLGGKTRSSRWDDSGAIMTPEVWNPETEQWRELANISVARGYHSTGILLTDGRMFLGGGGLAPGNPNASGTHQDAQIFSPPYLFAADGSPAIRPTVSSDNEFVEAGGSMRVSTTGNIEYFSLIRMAATTHQVNSDTRFYKPVFRQIGPDSYDISVHANPSVSVPGYWMLFAVDAAGVASEAAVVRVQTADGRYRNQAVDGRVTMSSNTALSDVTNDGDRGGESVATNTENQPYWEIDLGREIDIELIRLWSRSETAMSEVHVLASPTPFTSEDLNTQLAGRDVQSIVMSSVEGYQTDIPLTSRARYVRVQQAGVGSLHFTEVEVLGNRVRLGGNGQIVNLAEDGVATQSSVYANNTSSYGPRNSIDGERTGAFSVTASATNAWWELDLGAVFNINEINLAATNYEYRLDDGVILISDEPFTSKELEASRNQPGVSEFSLGENVQEINNYEIERTGRYVRVQLTDRNYMTLYELEVMGTAVAEPLALSPIAASPQPQNREVSFTATATGTDLSYNWNFGDGTADTGYTAAQTVSHTFAEPGRYVVSVTAKDITGAEERQTFIQIVHPPVSTTLSRSSGSVLVSEDGAFVWNVNPDNDTVSVVDASNPVLVAEVPVGIEPVALAQSPVGTIWVANEGSASISVIDSDSRVVLQTIALTPASKPYGIVFDATHAYVSLEATGEVIKLDNNGSEVARASVGTNPRHLTVSGSKLYVSQFISPPVPGEDGANPLTDDGTRQFGGEIQVLNTTSLSIADTIILQHSEREVSEHQGPGIPNYLGAMAISPDGTTGWVPSKQDNIKGGALRGNSNLTFDQVVRAVSSKVDLGTAVESLDGRVDHDNASIAGHALFDPIGVSLFVSLEGNRQISVIDVRTSVEITRFDTGRAPQGMALSKDGNSLFVHNFMDRTVQVFDVSRIINQGALEADDLGAVSVVQNENLDATVLRGKQLFYDARDDRLAALNYMACASCHEAGGHDGRVWDFTAIGEGVRNTITLEGRAGMDHGMLHWTANFDEIQDFEGQIREFAGGTGLMNDEDFELTRDSLGDPKAGLSSDLDALAAYLSSLDEVSQSPWRKADGTLSDQGVAGKSLFAEKGCADCHSGENFTDSQTTSIVTHDVGTMVQPDSGQRLGAALTGLDTPSLLGVWETAPYLHDGSAQTLQQAIEAHTIITLNTTEANTLAAYISQIDAIEAGDPPQLPPIDPPPVEPPVIDPPSGGEFSNGVADGMILVDGNISEWQTLTSLGGDADDVMADNALDWRDAWIAHDNNNFYIAYQADDAVIDTWGYGIYIDTDGNASTGFRGFDNRYPVGADYLVENSTIYRHQGDSNEWTWVTAGSSVYQRNDVVAEISIPRQTLDNPGTIRVFFAANNSAIGGTVIDYFPDGATDPTAANEDRYFTYTVLDANGNSRPQGLAQLVNLDQGETVQITLAGTDADNDQLMYEVVDEPAFGTLNGAPPNIEYTPNADFTGNDRFQFTVSDGAATSLAASVDLRVTGELPSNSLLATLDGKLDEWTGIAALGIDPLDANDVGDTIDLTEIKVAHNDDQIVFALSNANTLVPSWGYGIYIDYDNDQSTGFRGFNNEYPIGVDFINEGGYLQRYTGEGNDWSWAAPESVVFIADGNTAETAIDRATRLTNPVFTFFVTGNNAAAEGSQSMTIDLFPDGVIDADATPRYFEYSTGGAEDNRAPVSSAQTALTPADTVIQITAATRDADGDELTYQIVSQPGNGTVTLASDLVMPTVEDARFVYTPNTGFTGTDSFSYSASDLVAEGNTATVNITVQASGGTAMTISNPVTSLTTDGNPGDWSELQTFPIDAADISATDTSSEIDWLSASMAHSATDLYVLHQTQSTTQPLVWGHAVWLDTDTSMATGFQYGTMIGIDYMIEGASLYKYTGTNNIDWSWTFVATLPSAKVSGVTELKLSRSLFDTDFVAIDVIFRGDNSATGNGTDVDFYPDAAVDFTAQPEHRKFRYELSLP